MTSISSGSVYAPVVVNSYPNNAVPVLNGTPAAGGAIGGRIVSDAMLPANSHYAQLLTNMAASPGNVVTDAFSRARLGNAYDRAKEEKIAAKAAGNGSDTFSATVKKDAYAAAYGLRKVLAPLTGTWDTAMFGIFGGPALGFLNGAAYAGYTTGQFLGNGSDGTVQRSLHYPTGGAPSNSELARVNHPNAQSTNRAEVAGETGAAILGGAAMLPVLISTVTGTGLSAIPKLLITGVGGLVGGTYGVLHGVFSGLSAKGNTTQAACKDVAPAKATSPVQLDKNAPVAAPIAAAPKTEIAAVPVKTNYATTPVTIPSM